MFLGHEVRGSRGVTRVSYQMLAKWKLYVLMITSGSLVIILLRKTKHNGPQSVLLPDSRDSSSPMLNHLRKTIDTGKKLSQYLATLSSEKAMEVLNEFQLNGTNYFSMDTALKFLSCHLMPEALGRHVDKVQLDNACKKKAFRDTGKLIGLASFPGSGNTWTRTLLEESTGIYTGSIYSDTSLVNAGFEGECIMSRNVIAVKTHGTFNPGLKERVTIKFDGVIYIIRNLYDALVSEYTRRTTKSHISALPASAFGEFTVDADYVSIDPCTSGDNTQAARLVCIVLTLLHLRNVAL